MSHLTLLQVHKMNETEVSNLLMETIATDFFSDVYLDKLTTGQFAISLGENIQAVFSSLDIARKYYNRLVTA